MRHSPVDALDRLSRELADTALHVEYVLFGSTVMWFHGLRDEVGDIDIFVRRPVYDRLLTRPGWSLIEADYPGDPALLEFDSEPRVHAFHSWTSRDDWISVERCFDLAQPCYRTGARLPWVWRCIPLAEVRRHKMQATSHALTSECAQKHVADLATINSYLQQAA